MNILEHTVEEKHDSSARVDEEPTEPISNPIQFKQTASKDALQKPILSIQSQFKENVRYPGMIDTSQMS